MRKQMKIAAVVSAAALLAIGASFTSMAATYDWKTDEAGESVCYDADGELYTEAWAEWEGDKYFMDEDGHIVKDSWIEGDNATDYYYVDEDGKMVKSNWVQTLAYEADEDEDEAWFYFGTNGKMSTSKKITWKDNTYFVDGEGKMLTGWVDYVPANKYCEQADGDLTGRAMKNVYYVNEDGTLAASMWLNDYGYGLSADDIEDLEAKDEDLSWFYIKSNGSVQTGRNKDIDGNTYYFGADGKMLSGFVTKATAANTYKVLDAAITGTTDDVFFCGGKEEGWMKKNQWVETYLPEEYADADADVNTKYWYWIGKDGKVFVPTNATAANAVKLNDGLAADAFAANTNLTKFAAMAQELEVNKKTYLFNQNGVMMYGLVELGADQDMFYYGASTDGAKKTGAQTIADANTDNYEMFFATKKTTSEKLGQAIAGVENKHLYNENGILVKADYDDVYKFVDVEIAGTDYSFIVDENGKVQTSTRAKYEFEDREGEYKVAEFAGTDRKKGYVKNGESGLTLQK